MIEKFKVNERIRDKIEKSDLDKNLKSFLLKVLEIEFIEGKGSKTYSKSYQKEIEKVYILSKR